MLRYIVYGTLGFLFGVFFGLIIIGGLVSTLPSASLSVISACMLITVFIGLTFGVMLARRMNKRDTQQIALHATTAPSNGYIAAYIYAISTLVYVFLGFVAFVIFLLMPRSSEYLILEFAENNNNIPFLLGGNILLYILLSYFGIWYAAHVKHLQSSHSPTVTSWWFALLVLLPVVGDWQLFLNYVSSNFFAAGIVIAIGTSLAVLSFRYFLHSAQKNME